MRQCEWRWGRAVVYALRQSRCGCTSISSNQWWWMPESSTIVSDMRPPKVFSIYQQFVFLWLIISHSSDIPLRPNRVFGSGRTIIWWTWLLCRVSCSHRKGAAFSASVLYSRVASGGVCSSQVWTGSFRAKHNTVNFILTFYLSINKWRSDKHFTGCRQTRGTV